jgi:hypothetical protein
MQHMFIDFSEEYPASIFRAEELTEKATTKQQVGLS